MISISRAEFDRAVQEAVDSVPEEFRPYLDNVMIEVRGSPDKRFMAEHDVPDDLLGLYVGTPIEDRVLGGDEPMPDRIFIFRDNLCEMCESRDELIEEIRITVLHEIGHHFGLDEERLDELGYG